MSIQNEIARIKEVRKGKLNSYEKLFDDVKQLVSFAEEIQFLRANVAWNSLLHEHPEMKSSWDAFEKLLNDTKFIPRVNALMASEGKSFTETGALKTIKDRITRNYVTISVMGPVSAGKSVFLQALTGLDNNVIPVSADTCTATRSFFKNSTTKLATVYFHDEAEIIKIIMKHVVLLNEHLKNKGNNTVHILSESDVLGLSLASIIGKITQYGYLNDSLYEDATIAIEQKTSDCTSIDYYKTLKHYVENYPNYSIYVAHAPETYDERKIMSGQLKAFLAYDADVTYANAVEHVEINWPLHAANGESLGDIHLIDTMGIGEAKLGVSEFLTSTLRDETDIALALCAVKPSASLVQDPNTKMFQKTLKNAIVGRKPEQWIYYLLNRYNTASDSDVTKMKNDLEESLTSGENKIFLDPNTWGTVEFLDANGKLNREAVLNYFTGTVLFNLAKSIGEIDEHFITTASKEIDSLIKLSKEVVLSLKKVKVPSLDTKAVVRKRLADVKAKLAKKFTSLRAQSGDEIKTSLFDYLENNPLGCHFAYCFAQFEEIQKKVRELQPSLSKMNPIQRIPARLEKLRGIIIPYVNTPLMETDYNNGNAFTTFKFFSDSMYNAFDERFTTVIESTQLIERFQSFKRDVWDTFINDGGLGNILSKSISEWPNSFTRELEATNKYNDLKNALIAFNDTKIELKKEILKSIRAKIKECIYCHNDFRYNTMEVSSNNKEALSSCQFNDFKAFCLMLFNLLKNKENEILTGIKSDYENFIGANVIHQQEVFLQAISTCIFGQNGLLPQSVILSNTYPVYDQLEQFYIDNYSRIFGDHDDFSKKVEAIEIYNNILNKE